jgi:hypothetical protein
VRSFQTSGPYSLSHVKITKELTVENVHLVKPWITIRVPSYRGALTWRLMTIEFVTPRTLVVSHISLVKKDSTPPAPSTPPLVLSINLSARASHNVKQNSPPPPLPPHGAEHVTDSTRAVVHTHTHIFPQLRQSKTHVRVRVRSCVCACVCVCATTLCVCVCVCVCVL